MDNSSYKLILVLVHYVTSTYDTCIGNAYLKYVYTEVSRTLCLNYILIAVCILQHTTYIIRSTHTRGPAT